MISKFPKLRGAIYAKYTGLSEFATDMGLARVTISNKMNGKSSWSAKDIRRVCRLLDIAPENIGEYFFCEK